MGRGRGRGLHVCMSAQGIDWHSIRTSAQPPFVPHLSSITDTAYFPVDELADVPEEPTPSLSTGAWHRNARSDVASPTQSEREREREAEGEGGDACGPDAEGDGGAGPVDDTYMDRDIAFVGYTYKRYDYLTRRNVI
jgi:protein-serine/threonine kinase